MSDDMDFEQWQMQSRGVSPWLLVLFIVLTIGGLLGCYFLYTKWAEAQKITDMIQGHVATKVEKTLKEGQIPENLKVGGSPEKYGKEFWGVVKQYLENGCKYDGYLKDAGWKTPDDLHSLLASNSALQALFGVPNLTTATDLRSACETVGTHVRSLQTQLQERTKQLKTTSTDLANTKKMMESQRRDLQGKLNQRLQELAKVKDQARADKDDLRAKADQLEKLRRQVRGQLDGAKNKAKQAERVKDQTIKKAEKAKAGFEDKIAKLEEVEKPKPGADGKILTVNNSLKFATINIGEKDTVEKGERFEVYELSRGGKKTVKGEIRVKSPNTRISTVDILSEADPLNPIIRGDLIKRKTLRRKHEIKVRAERRAAARNQ